MVRIVVKNGETRAYLTDKGQQELLKYQLREKRIKSGRWDKKWRIVIFDIAEKRRSARDRIRIDMKVFGFEKLQDSVWVYPYECEEVISLLKTRYKAGKELVYIVASDIENDMRLRKTFQLE
jgi:DNA-binding transcriptional regulator PaaX